MIHDLDGREPATLGTGANQWRVSRDAVDLVRLRAYVAHLREKLASFGPAERFLIQRLEGLERLAALR